MWKGKSEFTKSEMVKLQQLSEKLKKDEVLSEEQNSLYCKNVNLTDADAFKWSVVEFFLQVPNTQLFWKGFLVEYWLKRGPLLKNKFLWCFF